jgi:dihydroorotate dehydrogenase
MSFYDRIRPVLFRLDAERAHRLGVAASRVSARLAPALIRNVLDWDSRSLSINVLGQTFPNPIGLAAGFDKNGTTVRFWRMVGAGHVEIGSVSARRCRGNPRPRAFRLPEDEALINRMGLNNQGAGRIARRLARLPRDRAPLGINIVKTNDPSVTGEEAVADFVESFRLLAPLAGYLTLNLSCPNTADGRTFEDPNALDDLLTAIFAARADVAPHVPVLLKLSPPISDRVVLDSAVDEIVTVALAHGVAGFVATNTTTDREGLETDPARIEAIGPGGLSGPPLENRSTRMVRYLYRRTAGLVPIIGVGGVASTEQAYRKIRAGASLVQLYTGLVYHGPGLIRQMKIGLSDMLARDSFGRLADAVGVDA